MGQEEEAISPLPLQKHSPWCFCSGADWWGYTLAAALGLPTVAAQGLGGGSRSPVVFCSVPSAGLVLLVAAAVR